MTAGFPAITAAALAFALWPVLPVAAQTGQPMGVVDALIDGAAYHGETLDVPSEGTATAEFRAFGPMTSITLQAHDPEAESIMRNVLAVEISLMGNEPSSPVIDVSVSYWPEGMGGPFYMSTDSGVAASVTFEGFSLGDEPSVSGSFSAVMCRHESMFAEADTDNCLPVEGRFDTRLRDAG